MRSPAYMQMQPARHEEPFFQLTATGDNFEHALKHAVRANTRSMADLHSSIRSCIVSLRTDGMQCEAALLTMKAFIRDVCVKHTRRGSREMLHCDMLMEQVVKWCISEYYAE